jgi:hypothetical protein
VEVSLVASSDPLSREALDAPLLGLSAPPPHPLAATPATATATNLMRCNEIMFLRFRAAKIAPGDRPPLVLRISWLPQLWGRCE